MFKQLQFKSLLLLCALIVGSGSAWAQTYSIVMELDMTTKSSSQSNYNTTTTYGDWKIVNGANNNGGWEYFKMGGKSATISSNNPCYIYSTKAETNDANKVSVDKVTVHLPAGSLSKDGMSVNSWGVYVYSDAAMTQQVDYVAGGTITNSEGTFNFTPSTGKTWDSGNYFKVSWDLANTTTTNGIVYVDNITLYHAASDPGKTDPSLSFPNPSYNATLGTSFTAPTLTTDPTGLTVTYESSETGVATVNENTGTVTLVGEGETTITASFAGNDSYNAATASYTLNVTDPAVNTSVAIDDTNLTNTNVFTGTAAGSLSATVKDNNEATISGATVTWSSSDEYVATIASDGAVTLVGEGATTITASYTGVTGQYKPSSVEYELTVTNEDPNAITLWSEDFSSYSKDAVPNGGTYKYSCGGSGTKIYEDNYAGGTAPELLVAKNSGSFTAVVPLNQASGDLKLTYKTNAKRLQVSTPTEDITIEGAEDGSISFNSLGEHTVTFTDVTTSMTSITIVFTATSGDNVRLDDILLKGSAQPVAVEAPTFSINSGTYYEAQSVELSCATDGATIYYTTNGDEPTSSSTQYTSAIPVSQTMTIKAIAIKGSDQSTVSSATYNITEKSDVEFSITDKSLTYGESYTITKGTYSSCDVQTDGYVTVSSDNTNVVSVNGMTITANAVGTATITIATAEGNTYKAGSTTITVTVTAPEGLTEAPSGTITTTFKNKDLEYDGDGIDWTASESANSFETASPARGVQFGAAIGEFTITAENSDVVTKVSMVVSTNGNANENKIAVAVGDTDFMTVVDEEEVTTFEMPKANDQTVEFTGNATGNVVISVNDANKSVYFKSITLTKTVAGPKVTLNGSGYATYCSQYPLDFSDYETADFSAWQITDISSDNVITFSQITGSIKGGQGILLKGDAYDEITLTSADSETVLSDNLLEGTLAPTYVAANQYYGLSGKNFVKVNAGTVPAGKALLDAGWVTVSSGNESGARLTFVFEEATGISTIEHSSLNFDDAVYNLNGQRVSSPKNGLYIMNGKKVVVK